MNNLIKSALEYEIPKISKRTGISTDWLCLWMEVENFYGDVQKKETREKLLLRLQNEYNLILLK